MRCYRPFPQEAVDVVPFVDAKGQLRGRVGSRCIPGGERQRYQETANEPSRLDGFDCGAQACHLLTTLRLEQFNGIAIGIFDLDLLPAGTRFHFVPEAKAGVLQSLDCGSEVRDA